MPDLFHIGVIDMVLLALQPHGRFPHYSHHKVL